MQKTKTKLLVASLLCVICLMGAAIAQILMTRQISNNMRMVGAANFKLVREDDHAEVTEIAWGDFQPLDAKNSSTILGTRVMIYNIGNIGLVFSWNCSGLDTVHWSVTCKTSSEPWPENSEVWLFSIASGNYNGYLTFYLTSLDPYSPPQDGSFSLNLYAHPMP